MNGRLCLCQKWDKQSKLKNDYQGNELGVDKWGFCSGERLAENHSVALHPKAQILIIHTAGLLTYSGFEWPSRQQLTVDN